MTYMNLMAGNNEPERDANRKYDKMIEKRGQKKRWQMKLSCATVWPTSSPTIAIPL